MRGGDLTATKEVGSSLPGTHSVLSGRDRVGVEAVTHQGTGPMKKSRFEGQEKERSDGAQSGVRAVR